MRFTLEQERAITIHDRNLIVTAGAGSGKTRVLVERFVALLDAYPDWSLPSIVAITFTEKAAREMRDRVRLTIEARIRAAVAEGDDGALERWLDHQAALTRARIGTIHALCATLLRANPAEARIDPAFDVLDEIEAAIVLEEAVDEAVSVLADDPDLAALLVAYGVDAVRGVLRNHAGTGAAESVEVAIPDDPGELLARWQAEWGALVAEAQAVFAADPDVWTVLSEWPLAGMPGGDKLTEVWRAVHDGCGAAAECPVEEFPGIVAAVAGAINLVGGKADGWGGKETLAEAKAALKGLRERLKGIQDDLPLFSVDGDAAAAAWLLRWRAAIRVAAECYAGRKQARAALDFDDLETRTRRLLIDWPEVAARYAGREFNHILVDEFQDTNEAQRDIVIRLAGIGQPGAEGRLFVVGDPKQSIYAFRGADVRVFGAVRADLVARGGQELPLAQSFRTHAALVEAFNDLFGRILGTGAEMGGESGEVGLGVPMTAFRPAPDDPRAGAGCPMTVIAVQRPPEVDARDLSSDDLRRWEAALLAEQMRGLVAQERLIWDRQTGQYRPVQYGDMAVLFQASTHQADYEDVFKRADVPYIALAGRGYFGQQEVRDLLNLLSALHNPADDLALAAALRSPLFGLSDEALFALRLDGSGRLRRDALWAAVMADTAPALLPADEIAALAFARDVLRDLHESAGRATIADILTRAIERTGFLAALTGLSGGARRRGNVEKLVALARASGRVSLGAFNAYARDLTAREVREGEAVIDAGNAVRLMSVHASKGLEFPIVILAGTTWTRTDHGGLFTVDPVAGAACTLPLVTPDEEPPVPFAWQHARLLAERRDLAERRRLLYVGATRAGDHLIMSGAITRHTSSQAWLAQWLAALDVCAPGDDLLASDEVGWVERSWGRCALYVPLTLPGDLAGAPNGTVTGPAGSLWDDLPEGDDLAGVVPVELPLLQAVIADPHAAARHLSATQLDTLGRAPHESTGRSYAAFRDAVLHDAPEPVRPIPDRRMLDRSLKRAIGDMVHRALRQWLLARNTPRLDLIRRLEAFAWECDLTDPEQCRTAVAQALDLLWRFEVSPICTQIERAPQVYRELPFVYQMGERVIHGQIDVVYFDGSTWHVLDYKTATSVYPARYYLQVGVYAAAVAASMGQLPETHLYYIHQARLWDVRAEEWQAALARLDDEVRLALGQG